MHIAAAFASQLSRPKPCHLATALQLRTRMSIATYPYAASPADPAKVIPLLPLLSPPAFQRIPAARLPARPDRQPLPGYTLTRHTFPGAYPRTAPGFVSYDNKFSETDDPLGNVYSSNKGERLKLIDQAVTKVREVYLEAGARTVQDIENSEIDEPVVQLAVNRFVRNDLLASPSDESTGITLIVCHANGFHKEMWEETIRAFLAYNSKSGSTQIKVDEIWALDFANQGESFRLNGGRIGPIASWADCVSLLSSWSSLSGSDEAIFCCHRRETFCPSSSIVCQTSALPFPKLSLIRRKTQRRKGDLSELDIPSAETPCKSR